MKRGRPLAELSLTTRQREELIGWTRRSTMSQALALRARIILACARTTSNAEVAEALRVSRHTVGKWRKRFSTQGVDGLFDGPRPGTPRPLRSEERRVGKEGVSTGRCGLAPDHYKKKKKRNK